MLDTRALIGQLDSGRCVMPVAKAGISRKANRAACADTAKRIEQGASETADR